MSHNSYARKKARHELRGGPKDGERIDYVFYHCSRDTVECIESHVTMGRIPGKNISYSDHEGVAATFWIKESQQGTAGNQLIEENRWFSRDVIKI